MAEINSAIRGNAEERAVIGEIALHLPVATHVRLILGGGAEVDVGIADPDVGGAIVLNARADRKAGVENHLRPRGWTVSWRRVGEALDIEIVEDVCTEERDAARSSARAWDGRNGGGRVTGADRQLGDCQMSGGEEEDKDKAWD